MKTLRPLINEIFRIKLLEFKETLTTKEFISKQISLVDNKLKLLAFLGRKHGNIQIIVEGDEELVISVSKHSSKNVRIVLLSSFEKFKWDET